MKGTAVKVWVAVSLLAALTVGVVYAVTQVGWVKLGYKVAGPPSMSPSEVALDLGTIPSGASGVMDFGKVAELDLPTEYELKFSLDLESVEVFEELTVTIEIYDEGGSQVALLTLSNDPQACEASVELQAGTYTLHLKVEYQAQYVSEEVTGKVVIYVSYS